ncbi:MAG: nucleotidyltransferase family protein [Methanobacteriaceae archaeon]|jgi:predicted nucleotidyltransferase
MKTFQEIKEILAKNRKKIKSKYKVKKMGIFGSYVRGEQKEDSDVDILVEFEEPVSLLKLVSFENFLKDITGIKVDVVPENDIRPELRENILNEVSYI